MPRCPAHHHPVSLKNSDLAPKENKKEETEGNSKSCMMKMNSKAFAVLKGKNFHYYMRKCSIMLGRYTRKTLVDLDLESLAGGLAISRQHARIYYDFNIKCFALEVLGRHGCLIRNICFKPGSSSIKLDNRELIRICNVRFCFILLTRPSEVDAQMAPSLSPPLVMVPSATNDARIGKKKEGDRGETQDIGQAEGSVGGLIAGFSAMVVEDLSNEQSGVLEVARNL